MILSHLVLAVALASGGAPAHTASPHDWAPMVPYVGDWTRSGTKGAVAVTRSYEPSADSRQLQVIEKVGRNRSVWGVLVFDADGRGLVLKRAGAAGSSASDLFLDAGSDDPTKVVFASKRGNGVSAVERVTLERDLWNQFVERVETSADGKQFVVVSETQFRRKQ